MSACYSNFKRNNVKDPQKLQTRERDFGLPPQCSWGLRTFGVLSKFLVVVYGRLGTAYWSQIQGQSIASTEWRVIFYFHVTVHRNKFLYNKTNRRTNFPNLFCQETLHVSGQFLCPSSGVSHCTLGTDMTAWKRSSNLHDIHQCRVYSGRLLMMDRGTARKM
jgi:hypothetical protein